MRSSQSEDSLVGRVAAFDRSMAGAPAAAAAAAAPLASPPAAPFPVLSAAASSAFPGASSTVLVAPSAAATVRVLGPLPKHPCFRSWLELFSSNFCVGSPRGTESEALDRWQERAARGASGLECSAECGGARHAQLGAAATPDWGPMEGRSMSRPLVDGAPMQAMCRAPLKARSSNPNPAGRRVVREATECSFGPVRTQNEERASALEERQQAAGAGRSSGSGKGVPAGE